MPLEVIMKQIVKFGTAVAVLAVASIGSFAVAQAAGADNCRDYALNSAQQQQQNETKKCGFSGAGWSTNIKDHVTWCETQPPQIWLEALQERARQLQGCG